MYHTILVPVAYEPGFDVSREIEVARALAAPGASVTMLHAMDPVPFYAIDYMPDGWREELAAAIEADMRAQGATVEDLRVVVVQDDPAHAILDWAVANEADCIVLASHRSDSALFGSTASRVARHASCAVHLIR
ncbi:MAG: universal stress protein [Rhodobacter sp.]|nr:universal stress protein [Paracoccaceae bacterium]MCC0077168.1 universal stress protein [Rhodobacter sp.]